MTKFENRGIEFQLEALTKEQAQKSFSYSCDCCIARGMRIDCDTCGIRHTHKMMMATLETETEVGDRIQNFGKNKKQRSGGYKGKHECTTTDKQQLG